jgi:flagellar biosynthesis/type III secretory pathway protein FliH
MKLVVSKDWCMNAAKEEGAIEAAYMRGKRAGFAQGVEACLKVTRKWMFMSEDVRECVKEIRALEPK